MLRKGILMRRVVSCLAVMLVTVLAFAAPASAQAVQSFEFSVGGFFPRGLDSRPSTDVLVNDLIPPQIQGQPSAQPLAFRISDLDGADVRASWNITFAHHVEAAFGVGYYKGHTSAIYANVVNPDGSNIVEDLNLRIVPLTADIRFLPLGKRSTIQPYFGIGVGAFLWHYAESGSFVDNNNNIFTGVFPSNGTAVGPTISGGVKLPLRRSHNAFTVDVRYQMAKGNLDPTQGFAGTQIDLTGLSTNFGFQIRF